MDPQLTQSINHVFYDAVYNGLVRLELEDSQTGKFKIVGSLAESWEQPDARTIIFNLRQGVKFHDGSDFDAEVAKWNFERQRDHPKSQRKSSLAFIESVDALDSHTLQITSEKDNAALLSTLAFGAAGRSLMSAPTSMANPLHPRCRRRSVTGVLGQDDVDLGARKVAESLLERRMAAPRGRVGNAGGPAPYREQAVPAADLLADLLDSLPPADIGEPRKSKEERGFESLWVGEAWGTETSTLVTAFLAAT